MEQNSNRNTVIKIIGGIVVVILAILGFSKANTAPENTGAQENDQNTNDDVTVQTNSTTTTTTFDYHNGTYTSTGNYSSPAGREEVEVTVTLEGDVVTDVTFVGKATNPGSIQNQKNFSEGFEKLVVGKNIDEITFTVVNGSSLTPKGFMDALEKIKTEAKA